MRLYRKILPKIARDVVRTLNAKQLIEVEEGRTDEAELDIAAVMVEYLNEEDRISKEARDALNRRGLGFERFTQVKKEYCRSKRHQSRRGRAKLRFDTDSRGAFRLKKC